MTSYHNDDIKNDAFDWDNDWYSWTNVAFLHKCDINDTFLANCDIGNAIMTLSLQKAAYGFF